MTAHHPHSADHSEALGFQQIRDAFMPRFKHFRLLTNLVIPMPDTQVPTVELDAVVICDAGVFIFEIKGHRDCLIEREDGNDSGLKHWFVCPNGNGERRKIDDPLQQNAPKRKHLRTLVPEPITLRHYALFPMPNVQLEPTMSALVLTAADIDYFARTLRADCRRINGWHRLDESEVLETEAMLMALQGTLTRDMHIENCKSIFGDASRAARLAGQRPHAMDKPVLQKVDDCPVCNEPTTSAAPEKSPEFTVPAAALKWLAIGSGLTLVGGLAWNVLAERHVSSSHLIGPLQHIGAGGIDASAVLETATGFYPIRGSAAFEKGASLMIETRGNGKRFVCDVKRITCVAAAVDTVPSASADNH